MYKQRIPGRVRSACKFIKAHRNRYGVHTICRILEVAVSGYSDWLQQPISNHAQEDTRLLRLIRASFIANHGQDPDMLSHGGTDNAYSP